MRSSRWFLLLAVVVTVASASGAFAAPGDIIFQDDFSSGNLNKWAFLAPQGQSPWVVDSGWAKSPSGGWAQALDINGNRISIQNVVIDADMRRTEASPGLFMHGSTWQHNILDVHWRLNPPNNFWSARIWIQSGDDSGYVKYATRTTGDVLDMTDVHLTATYNNGLATYTISDYYGHTFTASGVVGPAEGLQGAGFLGLYAEGLTYYDNVVIREGDVLPEPGSLVALACGLLGMAGTIIKRRR